MAQRASVPVYLIKAPCRYGPNMAHYGSGLSHMAHMAHMAPIWLRTPQFKAEYEGIQPKAAQKAQNSPKRVKIPLFWVISWEPSWPEPLRTRNIQSPGA